MGQIAVLRAGPLTSVQDLGRPRHRALGVSHGGALDPSRSADRQPARRQPGGGWVARNHSRRGATPFRRRAQSGLVRRGICGRRSRARMSARVDLQSSGLGKILKIGPSPCGCRAWLAIGGGVEVPAVLGSRSTDLRSGFGGYKGRALRDGDELSLGKATALAPDTGAGRALGRPAGMGADRDAHSDSARRARRGMGKV